MSRPTPTPALPHPTKTPEYWERLAQAEDSFAAKTARTESAESAIIHRRNASEYWATARRMRLSAGEGGGK